MGKYIVRRLFLLVPVAIVVYTLTFVFIRVAPGDIVDLMLDQGGGGGTRVAAEKLRAQLHLDKPIYQQYFIYSWGLLRGDLGVSFRDGKPVSSELARRAPITLELTMMALVLALLISIPAGVVSAVKQDTPADYVSRVGAVFFLSMPSFWLALLILIFPAIWWGYSPPVVYKSLLEDPVTNLRQLLPPAFVLGSAYAGILARFTRSSLLEVLRQDYIRTARAKGLTERAVIYVHAMKNGLIPVVTMAGLQSATLLSGAVIVESIFNVPGLGNLTMGSIFQRDYAQLQANVLFFAVVVVMINLLVDLSYAWLDPRVRYS
ncbi:MAG: ABC transporter permease [Chloroflexi bacterium]|nr:ABC transporter permease [Chloroflexota bacterium]